MSSPSRRHRVVLLLAVTLLATLSAAVPGKKSGATIISHSGLNVKLSDNQRRLRTHAHVEERGFSVTALAKATGMSKKPNNQKQVTQLFTKLKLHDGRAKLFESAQFKRWFNRVENAYSKANMNSEQAVKAIASTLIAKYGDEKLVEMIVAAKKVSSTEGMATKLEAAQMQKWLSNKVSADDALQLLKLDLKRSSVLENPQLKYWVNYMDMRKEDPYKWLLEGLLKLDDNSAIRTAGMLGAAKQNSAASPTAQKVEDLLLQSWMPNTADDIFTRLALNKQGEQLFENPAIVTWAAFVTKRDRQNAGESMLSVLKATYKDEVVLARLLAAAKERDSTKTIATNLEKAQFRDWSSTGKSTDDVFDLLKLDRQTDSMDDLLKSPLLGTWVTYAEDLKKNPYTELLTKLKLTDTDNTLEKILVKGEQSIETRANAWRLQEWLWVSQGKTAEDVFNRLRVHVPERTELFRNSWFQRWISYVTKLDPKNADQSIFSFLRARYSVMDLEKMFGVAHSVESTQKLAPKLEGLLRRSETAWIRNEKIDPKLANKIIISM